MREIENAYDINIAELVFEAAESKLN